MQLSIIIVNYNVKYFLEQCLLSVLKACTNISAEIIVVDNHSSDGSKEFFANRFSGVKFLWENENVGFAKANNKALKMAQGEKVLFLNPDTILAEDCLEKCLQYFKEHVNTGALGVKMIDGSGNFLPESKRGFPGALTSFFKITGLAVAFPKSSIAARYYLGNLPQDKTAEIDVVAGAFMMIDKKILDKVGGFDEDYFMYAEDIDLSYRIQKAGYQNVYYADTTIIHFKGESTTKQSARYTRDFYGAMILFVQKHYPKLSGIFFTLLIKMLIKIKLTTVRNTKEDKPAYENAKQAIKIWCDAVIFDMLKLSIAKSFSQIERIDAFDQFSKNHAALCFCEPAISFKDIIELMQQLHGKYSFYIHSDQSKSIIGSTDKNKSGIVIELNEVVVK